VVRLPPPLARVSPPDPAAWDALVADAAGSSVFHTSAWARLWLATWPGSRWEALVVQEGSHYVGGLGAIVRESPLGRTILAMPFATYGGPIIRRGEADPAAMRRLLLDGYAVRIRSGRTLMSELTWYEGDAAELPAGLVVEPAFTHVRPLDLDFDALLGSLDLSVRSRVRQAVENGLTVRRVADATGVRLYHELAVRTLLRHGGRPKELALHQRIFEHLVPAGLARYDLVDHQGVAIAGSLHLLHRGVALNWLTASDERHWKLRPNHLLIATVMRELCAERYREYNLGGSPADAAGLIRFKEGWGATRRTVLQARTRSLVHRLLHH
jgi:CelD/BcsL family acetyltransferase involved in cellulose biosynthesis